MMFSKYISKITNTIGTVNYLQRKSRDCSKQEQCSHLQQSSKHCAQLFDDERLIEKTNGNETNNNNANIALPNNGNRTLIDNFAIESQIILTAAIAKLRNTLFCYELV